ncbi:hypothetical protein LCGC14_1660010 [marine sediment metagenome]|uniref:Prepilin-type N-terminal cleavage/methylation domain-containing protein n=1 Tax=marine sediment metagenome TaxID=412755 RepID=A0A0F9IGX7_9ZZZZ
MKGFTFLELMIVISVISIVVIVCMAGIGYLLIHIFTLL